MQAAVHGAPTRRDLRRRRHADERCEIKSIIFCEWRTEIDLLDGMFRRNKVRSLVYHGGMSAGEKKDALTYFDMSKCRAIIMQIGCGGVGLNIQAASRVYILSPTWNPCIESQVRRAPSSELAIAPVWPSHRRLTAVAAVAAALQAIARAYRLKQTRDVTAIRVVIEDTVDERCLQVQQRKGENVVRVLDDMLLQHRLATCSKSEMSYIFPSRAQKRVAATAAAGKPRKQKT